MNNSQIVCFDLFETLITTGSKQPRYQQAIAEICIKRGINLALVIPKIYPFVRTHLMTKDLTYNQMVDMLLSYLNLEVTSSEKALIIQEWNEDNNNAEWIDDAEDRLKTLRKDSEQKIILISNITAPAWETINAKLRLEGNFDEVLLSYLLGTSKPDRYVWRYIEDKYPRPPKSYWMIGDNIQDDLQTPFARGWNIGLVDEDRTLCRAIQQIPTLKKDGVKPEKSDKDKEKVIILDAPTNADQRKALKSFGIALVDAKELTQELEQWDVWKLLDPKSTVLLFPGNGAQIVKSYFSTPWLEQWPRKMPISTSRLWIPDEVYPRAVGGEISPRAMYTNIKDVIIIDDVLCSGVTAKMVKNKNEPWFPQAKWRLATWVGQRAGSSKGFESTFSSVQVGNEAHKVPLNSISTLLSTPEIAESYAQRNFGNQSQNLLEVIANIRVKK